MSRAAGTGKQSGAHAPRNGREPLWTTVMASATRIAELEGYVNDWRNWRADAVAKRDSTLQLIERAKGSGDKALEDVLQPQADRFDEAARQLGKCTTYMESRLDRAKAGEDV